MKKPATYKKIDGAQYILDEFSEFGLSKEFAEKRKLMWKAHGYSVRLVLISDKKYLVYRAYPVK